MLKVKSAKHVQFDYKQLSSKHFLVTCTRAMLQMWKKISDFHNTIENREEGEIHM